MAKGWRVHCLTRSEHDCWRPRAQTRRVICAGLARWVAAAALSGHFEQVTMLESDRLADAAAQRVGPPSARHVHGLLAGGLNAPAELFPGFADGLFRAGAVPRVGELRQESPGRALLPRGLEGPEGGQRQHGFAGDSGHPRRLWPEPGATAALRQPEHAAVLRSLGGGHHAGAAGQVDGSARQAPDHRCAARAAGAAARHRPCAARHRRRPAGGGSATGPGAGGRLRGRAAG